MLQAINRAEVDIQVATAKQYPRDVKKVLGTIETLATMDTETAEDCFYALRRGRGNDQSLIEGVSVRLAEIIASAWGNMRVQSRIIGNDGKTITCQGVCHDLETNLAVSVEVKRRITDKNGRPFSEDMQVVTGNAGCAIAFRNAVLKVVPKAVTKTVINRVKQVAMGQSMDLETKRQRMVGYFAQIGVTKEKLLAYCGATDVSELDAQKVFELRGLAQTIKEGTTTVRDTFGDPTADKQKELAAKVMNASRKSIEAAMEKQGAAPAEVVDPETGEVMEQPNTAEQ